MLTTTIEVLEADYMTYSTQAEITPRFANVPRLRRLTLADVQAMRSCYEASRLAELCEGLTQPATLVEVVHHVRGRVSNADLVWLLCRPEWYEVPDVVLRWLAADWASAALPIWESAHPNDMRSRRAIEAARRFALGLIAAEELAAARAAAGAAARDAAGAAACTSQVDRVLAVLGGAA